MCWMASLLLTLLTGTTLAAGSLAAAPSNEPPAPAGGLRYRLVGPFRGGRATGVAGVPGDPNTYYFGAAAGGVWKTTNAGRSWTPLWDKLPEASPSVGAIVVSPSDPKVIYVGTGEGAVRGNVVDGNGVYKSTDAGKSWSFSGLRDTRYIGRMAISANDPNTVFVAAMGHLFGDNAERGLYRTHDGGKTWQRVLYVDAKTGAVDVQIDPGNPQVVWAAMWQVTRKPWDLESGGPGSGLYRSRDGGTTWERLSGHGLPDGIYGRIGVAPTSDPKRIYSLIEAGKGGLYRTDDGGASWKLINADNEYKQRAWYYTNVFADPKDPNKVFVMNTGAYKSIDGGAKFIKMPTFHGDNHQLWINPNNTNLMVNSNDGGGDVSVDGGASWTEEMNQPTAQFYHIATDNLWPYNLFGAQQDNTTVEHASGDVRGPLGQASWHSVGGGESGYVVPDPKDPAVVIANGYGGNVTRYDGRTGALTSINPWAREVMGWAPKDLQHRSQWTEPLAFSPHDPNVLYNANEVLFKSTDSGKSWTTISPDLTRNDKTKQISSGGPLTKDNTGVETYDTIFSVNESPVTAGLIWAGTDDGLVQLTRDGGAHWANVTPKEMPDWDTVDMVEPHPKKAGTAYVAVDGHRLDDQRPHAFRTDDYGRSWTTITAGLPADAYVHAIRADPARDGLLYAATENGIFVSFNDGGRWQPLQLNLPRTPVHDLAVRAGDLAVATHGRSFWILDDLSPLRQWAPAVAREPVHLFTPRPAVRTIYYGRGDGTGTNVGANPPQGAIFYYWLNQPAKRRERDGKEREEDERRVRIEILDASDHVVRTYPTPGHREPKADAPNADEPLPRGAVPAAPTDMPGLNRFAWDMRYEAAVRVPHAALWHVTPGGPYAVPGHYKIRLTVDGKSTTQSFDLVPDPTLKVTQADLQQQFDLLTAINREFSQVQNAVLEIRALHRQVAALPASAGAEAKAAAAALDAKADAVEEQLIQKRSIANEDPLNYPIRLNNQLGSLATSVGQGDAAPTAPQRAEFAELQAVATADLGKWTALKESALATLNARLSKAKVRPIRLDAVAERLAEVEQYGDGEPGLDTDDDDDR